MHEEILDPRQERLLPLIRSFSPKFYLVGGTAIALHLGHRRSIDFDLFTDYTFDPTKVRQTILKSNKIESTFSQGEGELTVLIDGVKVTFFHYPFAIKRDVEFKDVIRIPQLPVLGAMKSFALGRRAKWKDYVDLYFILQTLPVSELVELTESIFGHEFNEKLFRTQLGYFEDIDYTETINYMPGFETDENKIKSFLTDITLQV